MKRLKRSSTRKGRVENGVKGELGWELRPGGMLVQKRMVGVESSESLGHMIKIKVSHGSSYLDITLPAQSSFGGLKRLLANETGLEPKEQRLLYQGKERDDDELLHMVGVQDMSKVILLEDPASKEKKLEEMKTNQASARALEAVARVRAEVDKLSEKVVPLERNVRGGTNVEDKELVVLTELLMMQVLKLDAIEADGEPKVQRKTEVRRVQSLVDKLDNLKARNPNPLGNAVSVANKWEAFGPGAGSLSAPALLLSSTKITQEWELFD